MRQLAESTAESNTSPVVAKACRPFAAKYTAGAHGHDTLPGMNLDAKLELSLVPNGGGFTSHQASTLVQEAGFVFNQLSATMIRLTS